MAVMIPDSCPAKASAGEKRLFSLFRDILPDNFKVWYEPVVQGRYPDFVILADTFGLLIIEVKGWYAKDLVRVSDDEVELQISEDGQSYVKKVPNPIRQARDYLLPLVNLLTEQPLLRQSDGGHQGNLCFPYGYGVLLTNITREQLKEKSLEAVFPAERVLCRDELTALETARNDRETIRRLRQMFPVDFPFEPLTEDQIKITLWVVHPEVVVTPPGSEGATDELKVLDHAQEQVAKAVGDGHRVFFGVAGSGKTVLLLARARMLAQHDPEKRILLLCYNRALGSYLEAAFENDPAYRNVRVLTFHSWVRQTTGLNRYPDEPFEEYETRLFAALERTVQTISEAAKYDAIFIDEGHDFAPEWFRCIVQALKRGAEGDLLIAVDGAQSLYGRPRSFTWKSVGVMASGRSQRLSTNYRNTREVLDFAWEVTQAGREDGDVDETLVRVQPAEAKRSGPVPKYRACTTVLEEQAVVAGLVRRLKGEGIPDRDIAVLYNRKDGTRIEDLVQVLRRTEEVCWVTDPANPLLKGRFTSQPGVRVLTIHSAKGLEFPAVILCFADQFPSQHLRDTAEEANLFYVGLTRPQQHLVLTWTGQSDFTRRVEKSGKAQPWQNV